jgi:hypothetical protein
MKKLMMVLMAIIMLGCTALATSGPADTPPRPSEILDCENPEGREYVCYSDNGCIDYLKGYSALLTMKYSEPHEFHGLGEAQERPVVHINLYWDHKRLLMLGRWEAEKREHPSGDKAWYVQSWIAIYEDDCSLNHEEYSEGYRKVNK